MSDRIPRAVTVADAYRNLQTGTWPAKAVQNVLTREQWSCALLDVQYAAIERACAAVGADHKLCLPPR